MSSTIFKGYSDSVSDFVRRYAFPISFAFPEAITDGVEIPVYEDLTLLSSQDLGAYSSFLRAYSVYFNRLYMEAFASKEFFEAEEEKVFGYLAHTFSSANPKATATAVKQAAYASPEYCAVKNQLVGSRIMLEAANTGKESLKDLTATVSRELSRRISIQDGKHDEAY